MRSALDILWDFFRGPKDVEITKMPEIRGDEVKSILAPYDASLWISDGIFKLIETSNLRSFLIANPVNKRKYITEFHDCDDFCYELMGDVSKWHPDGAFGMVWGNKAGDGIAHAWNFFIDENKKVKYVEPQNDQIFSPSTEKIWVMII